MLLMPSLPPRAAVFRQGTPFLTLSRLTKHYLELPCRLLLWLETTMVT